MRPLRSWFRSASNSIRMLEPMDRELLEWMHANMSCLERVVVILVAQQLASITSFYEIRPTREEMATLKRVR